MKCLLLLLNKEFAGKCGETYSGIYRQEILTCATTGMSLEDVMLSGISQSQNDKCVIAFTGRSQICRQRNGKVVVWGRGWGEGESVFNGCSYTFARWKEFCEWRVWWLNTVNRGDPGTLQVWTAWVYLYMDFFNKYTVDTPLPPIGMGFTSTDSTNHWLKFSSVVGSICGCGTTETEDQLHHIILSKGAEHPWIWISTGAAETNPPQSQRAWMTELYSSSQTVEMVNFMRGTLSQF